MKTIRRWTTSIASSFDWMISQVENHEALVNSAIRDVQEAGARAQVQLKRMRQDGHSMRKRLTDLRNDAEQWKERAKGVANLDQKRALECLKRSKGCERELSELESQEREHSKVEKQLGQDLLLIEERLHRLKQQRNVMRTRQSRAEALQALQSEDGNLISEIDDIFDRWETKVSEYEINSGSCLQNEDELEAQFETAEEDAALKEELAALCSPSADLQTANK